MGQFRVEERSALRRGALPRAGVAVVVLGTAMLAAGCSMTFPIGPLAEPETTGSIVATPLPILSADLSGEDLVYAEDAMGVALDPMKKGTAARWSNPSTGRRGSFTAEGEAFVRDAEVCRYFKATVAFAEGGQDMLGMACRAGAGNWQLRKIRPANA